MLLSGGEEGMTMLAELKFTEARREFTSVIDRVQSLMPIVIQPRKQSEENTFLFKETLVLEMLSMFKFDIKLIDEKPDAYSYWSTNLGIYGYGETKDQAYDSLVDDLIIYSKQYIDNPARYFNSPNRRAHLPYVLKVMVCNNAEEVKQMLQQDGS
jgi:antitoxin YefM